MCFKIDNMPFMENSEPIKNDDQQGTKPRKLVYIRFSSMLTPYIFNAGDLNLKPGMMAVVETELGLAAGKVLAFTTEEDAAGLDEIKPVIRVLNDSDKKKLNDIKIKEKTAFDFCRERIIARKLAMKLILVEQSFDGSKITFFFVSESRVDFRELLKDLVDKYRTRIELRQIGSRQETCILGGLGSCGRELCCASFLTNFQRISVKMAKNQNMTLNPTKISGICGKLKCCLAYEKESYANLIDNLPKAGKTVFLEQGEATVISINVINQTFIAKLADRRFVKAKASDMLTEEEFHKIPEQKQQAHQRIPEPAPLSPQVQPSQAKAEPKSENQKDKGRRHNRNRRNRSRRKPEQ
jgi:cell fate regulator YaaT (PSP1 superfamily)